MFKKNILILCYKHVISALPFPHLSYVFNRLSNWRWTTSPVEQAVASRTGSRQSDRHSPVCMEPPRVFKEPRIPLD